jgi:hypothetical protein
MASGIPPRFASTMARPAMRRIARGAVDHRVASPVERTPHAQPAPRLRTHEHSGQPRSRAPPRTALSPR